MKPDSLRTSSQGNTPPEENAETLKENIPITRPRPGFLLPWERA